MSDSDDNLATGTARLRWDENGQPISARYGDVYFSKHNGLAETRYVFLEQNQLPERWQAGVTEETFHIGETGFGSGLNFLAAWQLWDQSPNRDTRLHFVSVENEPLGQEDLQRALALWPELADYTAALLDVYPRRLTPGFHRFTFAEGRVELTLIVADASAGLNQLLMSDHPHYRMPFHGGMQAWFLDGFAPAKNPGMWQPELFDVIAALSAPGCTLATFTAAGIVKRELQRVGFRIEKRPGYGRKRDMVAAEFLGVQSAPPHIAASPRNSPYPVPWHVPANRVDYKHKQVVVIGAGLAGSHSARALAERSWQVTVLDQAAEIASGASGNAQGVVYAKLSSDDDPLGSFNLACLQFAQRFYRHYWPSPEIGEQCGTLLLGFNVNERRIQEKLRGQFREADDFLRFVDARQASELAGVDIDHPALFFPQLGWMRPARLCRALLDHPNIELHCKTRVQSLQFEAAESRWQLLDQDGQTVASAPKVVIANACDARRFSPTGQLPLKAIRGQVSYFDGERLPLRTVICGEGYIAPAISCGTERLQSFGATFTLREQRREVLEADHRQNLAKLSASLPSAASGLHNLNPSDLRGRAAFRCTTPDYLPLVGAVPDFAAFVETFRLLCKSARASIPAAGPCLPGLYVNVGHGSRGLAYTPLSAALLAAQMTGDLLPVSRELAVALHPARFIIRDLIRRRLP
ncbi:bifunctional tRNA (5-methylaminomethyl-2-thiouridine)(34)-methyltransferase MnmD/FAD-dependent 5-carboxymethylaminomethyl-2-thiouridine(34) oxidoreductase MnmC [Proteobacteria bacterium 005FR1]|nr:bifunctional tRNA (5-methylaminomethyl-2-thiouridine)(34)-methyltransferase MnmD/FAD-dependent 5-carboxymethylaminomethyl-2-thiouridine(34) oxidoreductase MnmC [Proteobacteria bacterium 005FR1]